MAKAMAEAMAKAMAEAKAMATGQGHGHVRMTELRDTSSEKKQLEEHLKLEKTFLRNKQNYFL